MRTLPISVWTSSLPTTHLPRLRLREKDGPVYTNPRLGPAITFLKDIHLVGGQGLTDYGIAAAGIQ